MARESRGMQIALAGLPRRAPRSVLHQRRRPRALRDLGHQRRGPRPLQLRLQLRDLRRGLRPLLHESLQEHDEPLQSLNNAKPIYWRLCHRMRPRCFAKRTDSYSGRLPNNGVSPTHTIGRLSDRQRRPHPLLKLLLPRQLCHQRLGHRLLLLHRQLAPSVSAGCTRVEAGPANQCMTSRPRLHPVSPRPSSRLGQQEP